MNPLPEKYYLDYFQSILEYVGEKYTKLLQKNEHSFLLQFKNLTEDARLLYIRMIMRRGEYFRYKDLFYNEINDLDQALFQLKKQQFISSTACSDSVELLALLSFFKKAELQTIAEEIVEKLPTKSAKKEVWISFLLEALSLEDFSRLINDKFTIYQQKRTAAAEMIFFLYFGTLHRDLSEFVVRDLGFRSFEKKETAQLTAYFKTRTEVDEKWQASKLRIAFYERLEDDPLIVFEWLKKELEALELKTDAASRVLESLRLQAGKWLEQQGCPDQALWLYESTNRLPAQERCIRILEKIGRKEEALSRCEKLFATTIHAEEFFFARDFLQRLKSGKRTFKSTTKRLKKAKSITISPEFKQQVEMGALEHYAKEGFNGIFMENVCWRAFFGLLFWEIIFDDAQDAFHHPFQSRPSDWRTDLFYEKRKTAIDQRLEKILEPNWLEEQLAIIFKEKYGLNNPLIYWYEELLDHLTTLMQHLTKVQLQAVLVKIAENIQSNTKGFPDLFIWNSAGYQFIEIKSPRDTLSAQQLYWIEFFEEIGVEVAVVKVGWNVPLALSDRRTCRQ